MKVTTTQIDEAVETLRSIRGELAEVYALDRRLAALDRPDGYRSSVRPMEGSPSATDDQGETLPPHSDPTGATAIELLSDRRSCIRAEVETMTKSLDEIVKLARVADGARARAMEPDKEPAPPAGCINHAEHSMGWEPVLAKGRCRWCWEFKNAEGQDAPKSLLEARAQGRRITEAMVEKAVVRTHSKRARRRARKAG